MYERHSVVELEPVFELVRQQRGRKHRMARTPVNGVPVYVTSLRLRTFAFKGIVCAGCGLVATHFAIERELSQAATGAGYHLNLYGVTDGEEVLFTHDHIVPRSKGGADGPSNTQTMCGPCNWSKKDNV